MVTVSQNLMELKTMIAENDIKRDAHLFPHRDGLGDIFAGLLILSFGLGALTEIFWFSSILVPVLIPTWRDAKKRFARRRLQPDLISAAQRKRAVTAQGRMIALGFTTSLLGLTFFVLFTQGNPLIGLRVWLSTYIELVIGTVATLLLATVGAINRAKQFYLYAGLAFIIFVAGYLFNLHFGISLVLLGVLILLIGLLILIKFLQTHPALDS